MHVMIFFEADIFFLVCSVGNHFKKEKKLQSLAFWLTYRREELCLSVCMRPPRIKVLSSILCPPCFVTEIKKINVQRGT